MSPVPLMPPCTQRAQAALETLEDSEMDPARTVLKEFIAEVVHSEEALWW